MTKSLYEAPNRDTLLNVEAAEEFLKIVEMHLQMPKIVQKNVEDRLTEEQLNTLEWAKEFMDAYERRTRKTLVKES